MLKSAIFVTTAIASILSISSIADARDRSSEQTIDRFQSNLIAKKLTSSNSTISAATLKDIHQAIVEYYHNKNSDYLPSNTSKTVPYLGEASFFEVKDYLKLIYLGKPGVPTREHARVESIVERRAYRAGIIKDINNNPIPSFKKTEGYRYKVIIEVYRNTDKKVGKNSGKWKVFTDTFVDNSSRELIEE
jgi:hypothetical protein